MKKIVAWALRLKIVRAYLIYSEHRGPMLADSVTYRTLFGVFAGILLGLSAATIWLGGNPEAMAALLDSLQKVIPGIGDLINFDQATVPIGFTFAGIASLIGLVLAAMGAVASLRFAIRTIADEDYDEVPAVRAKLEDLGVAAGFGTLLLIGTAASLASSVGLSTVAGWLGVDSTSTAFDIAALIIGLVVVFFIDTSAIALAFRVLSSVKVDKKTLWTGAAIGGVGLLILQQFSGYFVRGAASNPLLASFASLIALLIWFNLSAQVILIASSWILAATRDIKTGPPNPMPTTMAEWREYRAKSRLGVAQRDLGQTLQENAAKQKG